MKYIIVNKDIRLEFVKEFHAQGIFELTDRNRIFLSKWLPWVEYTKKVSDTMSFVKMSMKKHSENDGFNCAIIYKNNIAGVIGLTEISKFENGTEIGYWLGKEFTGKGIMTDSCKAITDHCFRRLKLSRVIIRCDIKNKRSRRVPERLGYFKQGILKRERCFNGKFIDHVQYLMTSKDYESKKKPANF